MRKDWEHMFEANRRLWNDKTSVHVSSDFYDHQSFLDGKSSLNPPELDFLGNVTGKSILHLQCHFGQDTISLARLGAKTTGVDISDDAIKVATEAAEELSVDSQFVRSNVLTLSDVHDALYDVVFTSYGTIGWLPELDPWAGQVDHFLKPGGEFIIVEFHPFIWTLDDDFKQFHYPYFNREVIEEDLSGTYTDPDADVGGKSYSWNHPLSEVFNALSNRGFTLVRFEEYDYSPYECFPNLVKEDGVFRFENHGDNIPYMYAMKWRKP